MHLDFPGGPAVKTPCFRCRGHSFDPWSGNEGSSQVALESTCQCRRCRRCGFSPWVGKIPWRREWLPAPVFWPGESQGQRSLAGYSPWGYKESDTTEPLSIHMHTHTCTHRHTHIYTHTYVYITYTYLGSVPSMEFSLFKLLCTQQPFIFLKWFS